MKEKFIEIFKQKIKRPGSEDLLAYLEKSDFFVAPASTKFHLSRPGGLVEHSIHVYERLRDLYICEKSRTEACLGLTDEEEEKIAICALLHDICKVGVYVPEKKSRKTGNTLPNGKPEWEDYMGYEFKDKLPYGHGEKSVYMLCGFIKISREEAMAIRWHMGLWEECDKRTIGNAYEMFPLALLTHIADMMATNLDEKEE